MTDYMDHMYDECMSENAEAVMFVKRASVSLWTAFIKNMFVDEVTELALLSFDNLDTSKRH